MADLDRQMKTLALAEMRANPLGVVQRSGEHLQALWYFTPYGLYYDQPGGFLAAGLFVMALMGLGFGGGVPLVQRLFMALPIFYLSLVLCLILADSRYSIAAQPFLVFLAAWGLQAGWEKIGGDERIRTAE